MVEAQPKTKFMKLPLSEDQFIFPKFSNFSKKFYGNELSKISTLSAFKSLKKNVKSPNIAIYSVYSILKVFPLHPEE